ncbi:hypothetical protein LU631_17710 [Erwinia tracheiphila]|uniref:hypothetical protein n=1 Tax=Erwinia tracheiphila TaxID=65700 RepID=UPI0003A6395C|nr:hypothetical protein [Erwinia tracheiphila]UIA86706.1 hypothetical protein LU631_17710 [Erwinia tracheiphila]UIA95062.1 hypothetical protein LU633_16170 [Erwinia tracheiphila]
MRNNQTIVMFDLDGMLFDRAQAYLPGLLVDSCDDVVDQCHKIMTQHITENLLFNTSD